MTIPILAVIFDMDGVLTDSEPFICEAACRMFDETHRTKVDEADFLPFVGTGEDRYLGGVAEKHGVRLTMPRDKERTYAIYLDIIRGRLSPLPGAIEFIADLKRRKIKIAVATSADRIKMEGNLREIGLAPATFDACVTGSDIERKKPDPQIFLTAAAKVGVDPARCIVVEDAVTGIKAGKAAGSKCLGLTTSFSAEKLMEAGADWTAPNLAHVPAEATALLR